MKQIKIIDFQSINNFHEIINSVMIEICVNIYDKVVYKAGKSAIENNSKKHKNLITKRYRVCESNSKCGFFIRIIIGFFISLYEYLITSKDLTILFLYTNALSMPFILTLNIFLKKNIIFLMHGELELQYKKTIPIYKPTKYYKFCHYLSFKFLVPKTPAVILVLGDSIKNNLIKLYPNLKNHIISICHPYNINSSFTPQKESISNSPLVIGTIGLMCKEKGLENLINLSTYLQEEIKDNKLIIKCIGKVLTSKSIKGHNVEWIGFNRTLSRDEFEKQINLLDFILYLYPQDSYKLTASGAIMDAVKLHKPIISIKNDYFEYLMKDNIIGYMVNDINEITTIIKRLLKNKEIPIFENEFKSLEQKISISYNANLLRSELLRLKYIN